MPTDRDIWATANLVIRSHGENAWLHAAQRADELLTNGDVEGASTWKRVLAAIRQLQDTESSADQVAN